MFTSHLKTLCFQTSSETSERKKSQVSLRDIAWYLLKGEEEFKQDFHLKTRDKTWKGVEAERSVFRSFFLRRKFCWRIFDFTPFLLLLSLLSLLSSKTSSFIVTFFHFTFVLCLRLLTFFISSFTFVLSLVSWHSLHIILFYPNTYTIKERRKNSTTSTLFLLFFAQGMKLKKSQGKGVTFTQESHASTLIVFQSKKRWDTLSCLLITFVIKFLINKTS